MVFFSLGSIFSHPTKQNLTKLYPNCKAQFWKGALAQFAFKTFF